jgi:hypothetical protein
MRDGKTEYLGSFKTLAEAAGARAAAEKVHHGIYATGQSVEAGRFEPVKHVKRSGVIGVSLDVKRNLCLLRSPSTVRLASLAASKIFPTRSLLVAPLRPV